MKDIKSIMIAALEADRARSAVDADGNFTVGDFRYRLSDSGSVDLATYLGDEEVVHVPGYVMVPGEREERAVHSLSIGAFMQKENVREVFLGEGFHGMISPFMMCHALERVHLPDSVKVISGSSVMCCSSFKGFAVKDSNPEFEVKDGFLISKKDGLLISGPKDRTECVIPDGVKSLDGFALAYSSRMESVVIPEGVSDIGICAVAYCPMLWEVSLPSTLENIGEEAFIECPKLESLGVPAGVTFAGSPERDFGVIMGCYEEDEDDV